MIVFNSRARKGGKEGVWKNLGVENADIGEMMQHNQQHVAPCVKGVEWGLGTRGLRMVAAFWAAI